MYMGCFNFQGPCDNMGRPLLKSLDLLIDSEWRQQHQQLQNGSRFAFTLSHAYIFEKIFAMFFISSSQPIWNDLQFNNALKNNPNMWEQHRCMAGWRSLGTNKWWMNWWMTFSKNLPMEVPLGMCVLENPQQWNQICCFLMRSSNYLFDIIPGYHRTYCIPISLGFPYLLSFDSGQLRGSQETGWQDSQAKSFLGPEAWFQSELELPNDFCLVVFRILNPKSHKRPKPFQLFFLGDSFKETSTWPSRTLHVWRRMGSGTHFSKLGQSTKLASTDAFGILWVASLNFEGCLNLF